MNIDPREDGYSHLNIYTKGHTQLGRDLSNMASVGLIHPTHGAFGTMEGYWYWVATGSQHDEFKTLEGFEAKEKAKDYDKVPVPDFQKRICEGLLAKMDSNPDLKRRFVESTLPLMHYYYYGDDIENLKIVEPQSADFQVNYLRALRRLFRKEERAVEIYTVQLAKHDLAKRRRIPVIDTTVKSGDATFAPSWSMVKSVKAGAITKEEYERQYLEMMRESWRINNQRWQEVLNMRRFSLACYCPKDDFCHRHLLKDIFTKIARSQGRPAIEAGEIF